MAVMDDSRGTICEYSCDPFLCCLCQERYPTERDLFVHSHIHGSEPLPIFDLRPATESECHVTIAEIVINCGREYVFKNGILQITLETPSFAEIDNQETTDESVFAMQNVALPKMDNYITTGTGIPQITSSFAEDGDRKACKSEMVNQNVQIPTLQVRNDLDDQFQTVHSSWHQESDFGSVFSYENPISKSIAMTGSNTFQRNSEWKSTTNYNGSAESVSESSSQDEDSPASSDLPDDYSADDLLYF